jgi:hypothetical protein
MLSSVGLFVYFVKGGTIGDLRAGISPLNDWDKRLEAILGNKDKNIPGKLKERNVEKNLASENPQENKQGLKDLFELLGEFPELQQAYLDNVGNRLFHLDTEIALAWDAPFRQLVSHLNPFYSQLRVESKSKPGVRFYAQAWWGLNRVRAMIGRLSGNSRAYASLFAIEPIGKEREGEHGQHLAQHQQELMRELDSRGVPYMAMRAGPMTTPTLVRFMHGQYLRLAADAALYQPMEVSSEGQVGVEETKGVLRTFLAKTRGYLRDRYSNLSHNVQPGHSISSQYVLEPGVKIPQVPHDAIEESNESDD